MSRTSDHVIALLDGAHGDGDDDYRDRWHTGTRLQWNVDISDVTANVTTDMVVPGTTLHVEVFDVSGKWQSHIRDDKYVAATLVDKIWGDDKHPYGEFTLHVKAVDGGIASDADVEVEVEGVCDEPNEYARFHVDGLIKTILTQIRG